MREARARHTHSKTSGALSGGGPFLEHLPLCAGKTCFFVTTRLLLHSQPSYYSTREAPALSPGQQRAPRGQREPAALISGRSINTLASSRHTQAAERERSLQGVVQKKSKAGRAALRCARARGHRLFYMRRVNTLSSCRAQTSARTSTRCWRSGRRGAC